MRIFIAISATCLFLGSAAAAQEPRAVTPKHTEAQCMTDAHAWKVLTIADWDKTPYIEIERRWSEMSYCFGAYPNRWKLFEDVRDLLSSDMLRRETEFLTRNKLWDQFIQEDLAEVKKTSGGEAVKARILIAVSTVYLFTLAIWSNGTEGL